MYLYMYIHFIYQCYKSGLPVIDTKEFYHGTTIVCAGQGLRPKGGSVSVDERLRERESRESQTISQLSSKNLLVLRA